MSTNRVFGELPQDIMNDWRDLTMEPGEGGLTRVDGSVSSLGPLVRAMFRAEAELLVADAAAMAFGTYVPREPEERRHDAFAVIGERLLAYLQAA